MNKFNWDLINQPNTVVHCKTRQQAMELLTEAHSNGLEWRSGEKYINENYFYIYNNETCYCIYKGTYADIKYYEEIRNRILKFEEC